MDLDLEQVSDLEQRFVTGAKYEIVQSNLIALLAQLAAGFHDFGIGFYGFQDFDHSIFGGKRGVPALQQGPASEINEGFLGSYQIVQPDDQQAVGKYLLGSKAAFGAVELILCSLGTKEQLVAVHTTFAVEDGLSSDKHIHTRLSAGIRNTLASKGGLAGTVRRICRLRTPIRPGSYRTPLFIRILRKNPLHARLELQCQPRAAAKRRSSGSNRGKPELKGVTNVRVSLAPRDHFTDEIKPAPIEVIAIRHWSTLERLTFFAQINTELFEQRFERIWIDQFSLSGEVLAKDAAALLGEAAVKTLVGLRRCIAIVPDRLVADLHFDHRRHYATAISATLL